VNTVVISHGHSYREIPADEYEGKWENADGGWALLTDQEHGRAALEYLAAQKASGLSFEEFGRQAREFVLAAEQT
jgi:hypothetical protein